jgi:ornithine carbamoyltransferase
VREGGYHSAGLESIGQERAVQTYLRGKDLITLQEWTRDEIQTLLDVAFELKRQRALGVPHPILRDKVLAMLFFYSSTRTRASFEAGMAQLGGHAQFIESRTTQIAHGDTAKEIGEILGRYNDGIAIRNVDWQLGNAYLREVAEASRVPVLNMQCDVYHPHQALADLMTMVERFGDVRGRTATVSWAYAASYQKPISVPQSLILLLPRFGMNVRLVHPPEFELMPDVMDQARQNARAAGVGFDVMGDFADRIRGTDVVYAKSWGALLTTTDEKEGKRIIDKYPDWIADQVRMELAGDDAVYMHPLPADRGVEVADAVIDGPRSVVYDQAENRLHAQKAVMALTMS